MKNQLSYLGKPKKSSKNSVSESTETMQKRLSKIYVIAMVLALLLGIITISYNLLAGLLFFASFIVVSIAHFKKIGGKSLWQS